MGFWQGVLVGWLIFRNIFRMGLLTSKSGVFSFPMFLGYLLGDGILLTILYKGGFFGV